MSWEIFESRFDMIGSPMKSTGTLEMRIIVMCATHKQLTGVIIIIISLFECPYVIQEA